MHLQRLCGDASTEIACAAFSPQWPGQKISTVVEPGTYYLVLDGVRPDAFGEVIATIQMQDMAITERRCRRAPPLRPGQTTTGNNNSAPDTFVGNCATDLAANDTVYRLRVSRRQDVRIEMTSGYLGAIYLRGDCANHDSEVACSYRRNGSMPKAQITATLDPGTYFLIVDGDDISSGSNFPIEVQTGAPGSLSGAP